MGSDEKTVVVPVLSYEEFRREREASSEWADRDAYEDYLSEREGMLMALAMAGEPARLSFARAEPMAADRLEEVERVEAKPAPRARKAADGSAVGRDDARFGKTSTAA